ncbi:MAG: RusA family crossover junction endodeoxyribonuclease [Phycisphaeraceae bacterium]|nr:RusA family crossover junction endodeoxyribonuclease [Phycisphaeraceae bacterium]
MLEVELPFPPSVNHYWRHFRGRMVISEQGRRYRETVRIALAAMNVRPAKGCVAVRVEAFPPDRRRRDLDNLLKALCDALEHGGAFLNDSQIVWLLIRRAAVVPGGKVVVRIRERP